VAELKPSRPSTYKFVYLQKETEVKTYRVEILAKRRYRRNETTSDS